MKARRLLMGFGDTANIIQIYPRPAPPQQIDARHCKYHSYICQIFKIHQIVQRVLPHTHQWISNIISFPIVKRTLLHIVTDCQIKFVWKKIFSIFFDPKYWSDVQRRVEIRGWSFFLVTDDLKPPAGHRATAEKPNPEILRYWIWDQFRYWISLNIFLSFFLVADDLKPPTGLLAPASCRIAKYLRYWMY